MTATIYGIDDFRNIATGAAILASGGGGGFYDALSILDELEGQQPSLSVTVQDYDGTTDCCVIAMMGSPDAATDMTLAEMQNSIVNTMIAYTSTAPMVGCFIAVETGAINSLAPLIAARSFGDDALWVVNGDGAGRAVPELPQTTFVNTADLWPAPCALGNDGDPKTPDMQYAVLNAYTAAEVETLAGGVLTAFGSFAGVALWPSTANNNHALAGSYIPNTLTDAWALGKFLRDAATPPATLAVADQIAAITGRNAEPVVSNFYITDVSDATTSASLDAGVIRLDNSPDQADSTVTCYIYNLNENLIMYSNQQYPPLVIAPDSICYYSESTGQGFSNATGDLEVYYANGQSTGKMVSVIWVQTAPQLYAAEGVVASFAGLLNKIGYAGAMPTQ
jgi:DUF917 family protein